MRIAFSFLSPETSPTAFYDPGSKSKTLLALLSSLILATAPGFAQPPIVADLAESTVAELPIGSPLLVEWNEQVPEEGVLLLLLDEGKTAIAEVVAEARADGTLGPTLLWRSTGVVGCDEDSLPDPALYRFPRFENARQALLERNFTIEARDDEGNLMAEIGVALVPPTQFYYFSDGAACPRAVFHPSETLFLSVSKGGTAPGTLRTILFEPTPEIPCVGDLLVEIRDEHEDKPQQLPKRPGADFEVVGALADGADVVDPYGCRELWAVVRDELPSNAFEFRDDDEFVLRGPMVPCDETYPTLAHSGSSVEPWKPDDFGPCPPDED